MRGWALLVLATILVSGCMTKPMEDSADDLILDEPSPDLVSFCGEHTVTSYEDDEQNRICKRDHGEQLLVRDGAASEDRLTYIGQAYDVRSREDRPIGPDRLGVVEHDQMIVKTSEDDGKTWQRHLVPNDLPPGLGPRAVIRWELHQGTDIEYDDQGVLHMAYWIDLDRYHPEHPVPWLDESDNVVLYRNSPDGGATWSDPVLLDQPPDVWPIELDLGPDGLIVVRWADRTFDTPPVGKWAISRDHGASWELVHEEDHLWVSECSYDASGAFIGDTFWVQCERRNQVRNNSENLTQVMAINVTAGIGEPTWYPWVHCGHPHLFRHDGELIALSTSYYYGDDCAWTAHVLTNGTWTAKTSALKDQSRLFDESQRTTSPHYTIDPWGRIHVALYVFMDDPFDITKYMSSEYRIQYHILDLENDDIAWEGWLGSYTEGSPEYFRAIVEVFSATGQTFIHDTAGEVRYISGQMGVELDEWVFVPENGPSETEYQTP